MTDRDGAHVLVDLGSTFTKVRVVGPGGDLRSAAQRRTTVDTDVFEGLDAGLRAVGAPERADVAACSSAGGGLSIGVVGLIDDLTAEAGRQAALSAGARVERVVGHGLESSEQAARLLGSGIDMVLLVGGTDGGDRDTLLQSASLLAASDPRLPIVVAGNAAARGEALRLLNGHHAVAAANVMPAIGRLETSEVREIVRELFISHVIGGKLPGSAGRMRGLVRMATPDAVLLGVELLDDELATAGHPGGVIVVDVGGATTDVHSSVAHVDRDRYSGQALPQGASARTVEGDLGMRWTAEGVVEAASAAGLLVDLDPSQLAKAATRLAAQPGMLPASVAERTQDERLATLAVAVALRRHAGSRRIVLTDEGAVLRRSGRDLSRARHVVGTGGVLQRLPACVLRRAYGMALAGREDLLLAPEPTAVVDRDYILAAAGLLRGRDEAAARALLRERLLKRLAATTET